MKPCKVSIKKLPSPRKASVRSRPYSTEQHAPLELKTEVDLKPNIEVPIFCLYCDCFLIDNSDAYKHIVECRPEIFEDSLFDFSGYCFKHGLFDVKQEDGNGVKSCHLCITNAVYEEVDSVCLFGSYWVNKLKTASGLYECSTLKTEDPI
jgi:hypothetical protein